AEAAVGFYNIRDFKLIRFRMKPEPDKFGKCLNKLIMAFSDIVESLGGDMYNFAGDGAFFAFKNERTPKESIYKAVTASLKMRYVLNKLNRAWDLSVGDFWQVGVGLAYENLFIKEVIGDGSKKAPVEGKASLIAKGVGRSAGKSQVLIMDKIFERFPSMTDKYDMTASRHVPVTGADFLIKVREVLGIEGPQGKRIFDEFI
ncbi:MAG: hypothetical protein GY863_18965, partial [bacterium]|nr:hypothetical protein [bacterium]